MAEIVHYRNKLLQDAPIRVLDPSADKAVMITADAKIFKVDVLGAPTPAVVHFIAKTFNIPVIPTFSVGEGATLTNINNYTCELTFNNMTVDLVKVYAKVTFEGIEYTSEETIQKVVESKRGPGAFYATGDFWSDSVANAATLGDNLVGDTVTISNGMSYVEIKRWNGVSWELLDIAVDGGKITLDSITASMIKDGIIDTAKFAQGIEPISISSIIPTVKTTSTIFYTGDNKIYTWDADQNKYTTQTFDMDELEGQLQDAQIAAVAASKITGQLLDAQIAAVNAAKIAGELTNASIAAAKINGQIIDSQIAAVEAAKISGLLTNAQIDALKVTGQLVTAQIQDGAILSDKIAANAVRQENIAAGAITAKQLAIGDFENLVNCGTGTDISGFSGGLVAQPASDISAYNSTYWNPMGQSASYVLYWKYRNNTFGPEFSVQPGDEYSFSMLTIPFGGYTNNFPVSVGFILKDYNGNLSYPVGAGRPTGLEGPKKSEGSIVIPQSVITAQVFLLINADDSINWAEAGNGSHVSNIQVRRKNGGNLIVDGAITANKIAANSIDASKIQAGAITAGKIAAGAITAGELSVGINGNLIRYSTFPISTRGWAIYSLSNSPLQLSKVTDPLYTFNNETAAVAPTAGPPADRDFCTIYPTEKVGIEGLKWYEISVYVNTHRCNSRLTAEWYDSSGTLISVNYGSIAGYTSKLGNTLNNYNRLFLNVQAPSNASYAIFTLQALYDGQGFPVIYFLRMYAGESTQYVTTPSTWSPMGVTQIDGQMITSKTIAADQIMAKTITASEIAVGTITAGEIAAGTITAGQIAAGAITADQIAANAITAAKIQAGSIEVGKLAAGSVVALNMTANSVNADALAANSVVAGKVAANAITAGTIAANAVTAGTIAAAAINAREIAAGAITTDKLAIISRGMALNSDVGPADSTAWTFSGGAQIEATGANTGSSSGNTCMVSGTVTNISIASEKLVFPINAGKTYRLSINARSLGATESRFYARISRYDANMQVLGDNSGLENVIATQNWQTFTGTFVAETNAVIARTQLYLNWGASGDNSTYVVIQNVRCEEVLPGTLIENGAITTVKIAAAAITADQIAANAVTADKITASAITADKITASAITADKIATNAITADKVAAGAVTAAKINVTNLASVNSDLGAVTAGSININNRFVVNSSGQITISSPNTGAGYTITDSSGTRVYDGNNVLRVRLGIW